MANSEAEDKFYFLLIFLRYVRQLYTKNGGIWNSRPQPWGARRHCHLRPSIMALPLGHALSDWSGIVITSLLRFCQSQHRWRFQRNAHNSLAAAKI